MPTLNEKLQYLTVASGGHKRKKKHPFSHKPHNTHKPHKPYKTHAPKPHRTEIHPPKLTDLSNHLHAMKSYHSNEAEYHKHRIAAIKDHFRSNPVSKKDWLDAIKHHKKSMKYHKKKAKSFLSRGKELLSKIIGWFSKKPH